MKQIYYVILEDIASNPNVKNWVSMVKNPLSNLEFYQAWASQGVGNVKKKILLFPNNDS